MNIPDELFYTKTHEWVRKVNQKEIMVGITELKMGAPCAVIESVKAAYDIYSPLSGKVTLTNKAILEKPQLVNEDPYGVGWLVQLEFSNPDEFENLLNPGQYRVACESEAAH